MPNLNSPQRSYTQIQNLLSAAAGRFLAAILSVLLLQTVAPAQWELGPTGTKVSLRGLAAVDDRVLWACGSQATVLRSTDGGSSWNDCGPDGFEDLEFRSIHAWDAQEAIIASAGTPAVILRTSNGGETWMQVYEHKSKAAFFDALRFWDDKHGLAFSDPVDGRLLVVETSDSGQTWAPVPKDKLPPTAEGEAGFAASNSALLLGNGGSVWIGTGGVTANFSRVFHRAAADRDWQIQTCPLHGSPTSGIFSLADGVLETGRVLVAVGGDYRPEATSATTAALSRDDGKTWQLADQPPAAYRSAVVACLESDNKHPTCLFVATGPSGTDFSSDGNAWFSMSERGFHSLAFGKQLIFAVGAEGRFGSLRLSDALEHYNQAAKLQTP